MNAIGRFLVVASVYRDATGLKTTVLSWRLFGDSKKLGAVESGADMQVTRYERALQWLSENWPEDLPWPADGSARPERAGCAADPATELARAG